ncbi:MAG: MFS transporter, partial [Burkholderiales bacterium]|nr:MFS transporter [Burkholderiales bacterium]
YLALLCSLPVIGGWISDNLISNYHALQLGATLLLLGNFSLVIQTQQCLYFGLTLTICGTSLYKTSCTTMVGKIYQNRASSENGYAIFYVILNIGAVIAPIIYGAIAQTLNWNYSFLAGSFGIAISLILFWFNKHNLKELGHNNIKHYSIQNLVIAYLILIALILFVYYCFVRYEHFDFIFIMAISCIILKLVLSIRHLKQPSRKKIYPLFLLLLFCTLFFTASLQVGSSISLFVDNFIHKGVLGYQIPTPFFTALDPLFVVLSAPVFPLIWKSLKGFNIILNVSQKVAIGLLIGAISFIFFGLSSLNIKQDLAIANLILGYLFIGAGEICLSPAVLSKLEKDSPEEIKNTIMGLWYFFMGIAGYLSEFIDKLIYRFSPLYNFNNMVNYGRVEIFRYIFFSISVILIVSGIILFLFSKEKEHV